MKNKHIYHLSVCVKLEYSLSELPESGAQRANVTEVLELGRHLPQTRQNSAPFPMQFTAHFNVITQTLKLITPVYFSYLLLPCTSKIFKRPLTICIIFCCLSLLFVLAPL